MKSSLVYSPLILTLRFLLVRRLNCSTPCESDAMATLLYQLPSPSPSVAAPDEASTRYGALNIPRKKMLNIQDLLNPSVTNSPGTGNITNSATPPATPASTAASSHSTASRLGTPATTASTKYQNHTKGLGIATYGEVKGRVNYAPYALDEYDVSLTPDQRHELSRQHKLFLVLPVSEDEEDSIGHPTRHIPYSSDKKTFGGKTGRDGFDGKSSRPEQYLESQLTL